MNAVLARADAPASGQSATQRLLLIESEDDQAIYWSALLSSLGFPVTRARSLSEALERMTTPPDLIVCAAHLSDGRGSDFFATVRRREDCSRVYLILLTSSFGQEELIESLSFGANDCMDKGATFDEVRARLRLAGRVIGLNEALHEKSASLSHTLDLMRRELESAARLQSAMLPKQCTLPRLSMDVFYSPSDMLGGDMLGFALAGAGGRVVFGLIDVVGHGTASALISCSLMRELMDRLVSVAEGGLDPGSCAPRVIQQMNARYCALGIPGMYFTALAGLIDPDSQRMHYCQAGHPSLYHFNDASGWGVLDESGFPVGLFENVEFTGAELALLPGDRVLMVSDGLLRPTDADSVGSQAVHNLLRRKGGEPKSIIAGLGELAAESVGQDRDDQSAMLLSFTRGATG